ncbi:variant erythrocyte surface antigen-1 family protein [Babesia caballi]|uniref:Variant erythrocyte surface antigen-1 family protein n=1 Tax=Babesia caballi TaxID=5871 RepID=A0AAV4LN44_BABCB|nr:variant erythrocyte surface antigen-1 family protein [Babesia caballi]
MTSGGKPLTDPPKNLKEAIDWVLCMSGNYGEGKKAIQKLAKEVLILLNTATVGEHPVGNVHGVSVATLLCGDANGSGYGADNYKPIESLGNGLRALIGWQGGTVGTNGIGKQEYEYSYKDQNTSSSVDNDNAAKIFLALIPLVFFALGFLYWQCQGQWKTSTVGDGPLHEFLVHMGFTAENLNKDIDGSQISGMFAHFDEFKNAEWKPTYPAFLQKVGKEGKMRFMFKPSHVPLYILCLIALTYITKTSNPSLTDKIPQTQNDIIETLNKLSEAMGNLRVSGLEKLSNAYLELNTAITNAIKSTESTSSGAGSIAGSLFGTAAVGGAGAALATNVGGITTTLTNFIPIFK